MAIAALSTAGFSQYVSASSNVSASQQAWQSLQQGLASGNLTAAQTAFSAYSQLNQNLVNAGGASSSSSSSSGSQISTDLKALGSAIGSGDLSTAQSAFSTVQNDLKSTPSQAITNAESAVSQTVQWVDDLLSLSDASNSSATPVDPTTSILDTAYGVNSAPNSADPTLSILNSAYGDEATPGSTSAAGGTASANTPANSGNIGSGASVNAYA
jgi:ribosomal protein S20